MERDGFFYDNLWHRIKNRIVNEQTRAYVIYNGVIEMVKRNIPGDIAEVGCYKGGVIRLMAEMAKDKNVFGFDTFEGFNKQLSKLHKEFDADFTGKLTDNSYDDVVKFLSDLKNVTLIKGIFPKSMPKDFSDRTFCFVHIDCDIYKPTIDSLNFFYPRMSKDGWIVLDDYIRLPGVTKAINEFFSDKKEKIQIISPLQACVRKI